MLRRKTNQDKKLRSDGGAAFDSQGQSLWYHFLHRHECNGVSHKDGSWKNVQDGQETASFLTEMV